MFSDVVAAYKGLVKEKEALEISLKALNKTESPVEGPGGGKFEFTWYW